MASYQLYVWSLTHKFETRANIYTYENIKFIKRFSANLKIRGYRGEEGMGGGVTSFLESTSFVIFVRS